jgi:hypothetical protein
MVRLKRNNSLIKGPKKIIKITRIKLNKITYHKLGLKDKIENKFKFYKMIKNKN